MYFVRTYFIAGNASENILMHCALITAHGSIARRPVVLTGHRFPFWYFNSTADYHSNYLIQLLIGSHFEFRFRHILVSRFLFDQQTRLQDKIKMFVKMESAKSRPSA